MAPGCALHATYVAAPARPGCTSAAGPLWHWAPLTQLDPLAPGPAGGSSVTSGVTSAAASPRGSSSTRRAASGARAGGATGARPEAAAPPGTRPAEQSQAVCVGREGEGGGWRCGQVGGEEERSCRGNNRLRRTQGAAKARGGAQAGHAGPRASVAGAPASCLAAVQGCDQVGLYQVATARAIDDRAAARQPGQQLRIDNTWCGAGAARLGFDTALCLPASRAHRLAARLPAQTLPPGPGSPAPRVSSVSGSKHTSTSQPATNSRSAPPPLTQRIVCGAGSGACTGPLLCLVRAAPSAAVTSSARSRGGA